jgi:hypothetical protein
MTSLAFRRPMPLCPFLISRIVSHQVVSCRLSVRATRCNTTRSMLDGPNYIANRKCLLNDMQPGTDRPSAVGDTVAWTDLCYAAAADAGRGRLVHCSITAVYHDGRMKPLRQRRIIRSKKNFVGVKFRQMA